MTFDGRSIELREGMSVTAYDEDQTDLGQRDDLLASGTVIPSPDWLACRGSRWALKIDARGVYHESDAPLDH
jgi:hypothetical protein